MATKIRSGGPLVTKGGEGEDMLAFATGMNTADGGAGNDRLEIDARGQPGAVQLIVPGNGPTYSGNFTWAPAASPMRG